MSSPDSSDHTEPGPLLPAMPFELLAIIVKQIRVADVSAMARTSKVMHKRMFPFLCERLMLSIPRSVDKLCSPQDLWRTMYDEDGVQRVVEILDLVQDLRFQAPRPYYMSDTCAGLIHRRKLYRTSPRGISPTIESLPTELRQMTLDVRNSQEHRVMMQKLYLDPAAIWRYLPRDGLLNFSWEVGCCIPPSILGSSGYIPIYQSKIRSLTLSTHGMCEYRTSLEGLVHLKNLQVFKWLGVHSSREFELFREVLKNNSAQLRSIEVQRAGPGYRRSNFGFHLDLIQLGLMNPDIRHFPRDEEDWEKYGKWKDKIKLVKLRTLRLHEVNLLDYMTHEDELNFDLAKLTHLSLNWCAGTFLFFKKWHDFHHGINLESLRMVVSPEAGVDDEQYLVDLMQKHRHMLKELCLACTEYCNNHIFLEPFALNVERLVLTSIHSPIQETTLLERDFYPTMLHRMPRLKAFGLGLDPHTLRGGMFTSEEPFTSIKMIHFRGLNDPMGIARGRCLRLRKSTEKRMALLKYWDRYHGFSHDRNTFFDVVDFASWAFDCASVLPNLQVIAMGRFQPFTGHGHDRPGILFVRRQGHTPADTINEQGTRWARAEDALRSDEPSQEPYYSYPFEICTTTQVPPWCDIDEECLDILRANNDANAVTKLD